MLTYFCFFFFFLPVLVLGKKNKSKACLILNYKLSNQELEEFKNEELQEFEVKLSHKEFSLQCTDYTPIWSPAISVHGLLASHPCACTGTQSHGTKQQLLQMEITRFF